jgi:hypothetical protein
MLPAARPHHHTPGLTTRTVHRRIRALVQRATLGCIGEQALLATVIAAAGGEKLWNTWNYFTTPFLFTYPGVIATEIEPWHEAGQTWRRLHVRFPSSIATHSPEQVFYFDSAGVQRRMDYITEVLGSTLVGHYSGHYRSFDGLLVATRRRIFRRNPDNTVNLNQPSITLDIGNVELHYANEQALP